MTTLTTYMEYQQIEDTLIKYNQLATDLFSVRTWWIALSETEQAKQYNIDGWWDKLNVSYKVSLEGG